MVGMVNFLAAWCNIYF